MGSLFELRVLPARIAAVLVAGMLALLPQIAIASEQQEITSLSAGTITTMEAPGDDSTISFDNGDVVFNITGNDVVLSADDARSKLKTYLEENDKSLEDVKTITVIGDVVELGAGAFQTQDPILPWFPTYHLTALESVDLSQTRVSVIRNSAFGNDGELTRIVFPSNVDMRIETMAFDGCAKYTQIEWPSENDATKLDLQMSVGTETKALDASSVRAVKFIDTGNVVEIGWFNHLGKASLNDDGILNVFPNSKVRLTGRSGSTIAAGVGMLGKTDDVRAVVFENGCDTVADMELFGLANVASVTFPSNISAIGNMAFQGCTLLSELDLSGTRVESLDYSSNMIDGTSVETVRLPKTLKSIGASALRCETLKTIIFADDGCLETIGASAIQNTAIESIVIPDTVKSIGSQAFMACTNLKSVSLPASIEDVDTNAFQSSNSFLSEGELVVRDTCAIPAALKDKNFTAVVKPALEHSFTTYGVAEPAEGAEAPEGLVLHRACAACGELDPDAQDVPVDELLEQTAGEAAAEVAKAACEAVGIEADPSKTPEENVAAAKAAAEEVAASEAADKAKSETEDKYKGYASPAEVAAAKEAAAKEAVQKADAGKVDLSKATVTVAKATFTGKVLKPTVTVKLNGSVLSNGKDYKLTYVNNKNAGKAAVVVSGTGKYVGTAVKSFAINKAKQPLVAKTKAVKVKASKVKKAKQTVAKSKAFKITKNKGKVTFKKTSGNSKITVSSAGKVTVKKGLKKGTYKIKVKVRAAGNANYKAGAKTLTLTVKVK